MDYPNNNLKKAKNKRMIYLFFATFFLSMFLVGLLIKTISPNVDVEIGDEVQTTDNGDEADVKGIDNRLKWIQFEDNMPGVSKRFSTTDEEATKDGEYQDDTNKIDERVRNIKKNSNQEDTLQDPISTITIKHEKSSPPVPSSSDVVKQINAPSAPIRMAKVYIGYYTSIEQAIATQNKLLDSTLNVSPFVKEVNGYYVVQVGSYANRQKAQSLAGEVSALGFPAKVVSE